MRAHRVGTLLRRIVATSRSVHRALAVLALAVNGVAAALLLFAFQVTSVNGVSPIPNGICFGNCPGASAVVKSDNPWMFKVGFSLMIASVVGQIALTVWDPEP